MCLYKTFKILDKINNKSSLNTQLHQRKIYLKILTFRKNYYSAILLANFYCYKIHLELSVCFTCVNDKFKLPGVICCQFFFSFKVPCVEKWLQFKVPTPIITMLIFSTYCFPFLSLLHQASVAQQAARQSHNLKAVSSSLTGGILFQQCVA